MAKHNQENCIDKVRIKSDELEAKYRYSSPTRILPNVANKRETRQQIQLSQILAAQSASSSQQKAYKIQTDLRVYRRHFAV